MTATDALAQAVAALTDAIAAQQRTLERVEALLPAPSRPLVPSRLATRRPHRLDALTFARAIPGYLQQFDKDVPAARVTPVDGGVRVECRCGQAPTLPAATPTGCGCGRTFIWDGHGRVWAHSSPPARR